MPPEHSPEPKGIISQFEKLLADLARADIDFAVVGGIAVILNGYPRLTVQGNALDHFRSRLRYLDSCGARIPYLAPEDLMALKQGSWREKDQLDVAALREILQRERSGE